MSLAYIDVNPSNTPNEVKAVVIWLHGLGDSGHGFAPIVPELKLPAELAVRFVFPHAPVRPVTINNGMAMNAWYDIKSMDLADRADLAGVIESCQLVQGLIDDEIAKGVSSDKIVLAGFSQGGVIALHLATRIKQKIAGVLALSCYLCAPQLLASEKHPVNQQTPFFMSHGRMDDVVPFQAGQLAKTALLNEGFQVTWRDYPMQHNVCGEQLADISQWLQQRLAG